VIDMKGDGAAALRYTAVFTARARPGSDERALLLCDGHSGDFLSFRRVLALSRDIMWSALPLPHWNRLSQYRRLGKEYVVFVGLSLIGFYVLNPGVSSNL
jgi:hypothetical protein